MEELREHFDIAEVRVEMSDGGTASLTGGARRPALDRFAATLARELEASGTAVRRRERTGAMKDALADAANALGITVGDLENGKTFEAVVLLTCARLAQEAYTVEFRDHTGASTTTFIMRGAPGHLPDPEKKGEHPSHILLRREEPAKSLELHNSLEFTGASRAEHEMDVSAIRHSVAEDIRAAGGGPVSAAPEIGIELKEHKADKQLDKNAVRAFVACCVDLMPLRHLIAIAVGRRNPTKKIGISHPVVTTLFLTTAGVSAPSDDLASFYGIDLHGEVTRHNLNSSLDKVLWHCLFHEA